MFLCLQISFPTGIYWFCLLHISPEFLCWDCCRIFPVLCPAALARRPAAPHAVTGDAQTDQH